MRKTRDQEADMRHACPACWCTLVPESFLATHHPILHELIRKTGWKINHRSLPLSLLLGEPLVAFVVARDREESEIEEEQEMTGQTI